MTRHTFLLCFVASITAVDFTLSQAAAERPNIVIIVADDLGWADVGYHSSSTQTLTPQIDGLARQGIELDQHYVAPMCSPTRAALLSGRYWSRFGITGATNNQVFPFGTVTLASALSSLGYQTAITGKWHLGSRAESGPRQFGFDRSYGSLAGGVGPWNQLYKKGTFSRTWHRDDNLIEEQGHVTDLITAEATRFIEADHDSPFFLYVPFTAVHHPLDEPQPWLAKGKNVDPERPQFAACTLHMDDCVGKIVTAVDEAGQKENTLLVFFSDNGGQVAPADSDNARYPGTYPNQQPLGRNEPLRGRKSTVYEGGIRTPAFVYWPGRLSAPKKVTAPLHVVDWMPTLCQLVGYAPRTDLQWDGRDIWAVLTGEQPAKPRVLYWQGVGGRSAAIREGDWKLIVHTKGSAQRVELFNLANDPQEKYNVASAESAHIERLQALLADEMGLDDVAVVQ